MQSSCARSNRVCRSDDQAWDDPRRRDCPIRAERRSCRIRTPQEHSPPKRCVGLMSLLSATRSALRARRDRSRDASGAPFVTSPNGAAVDDFSTVPRAQPPQPSDRSLAVTITPYQNGPYLLRGPFSLRDQNGAEIPNARRVVALCRCGKSRTRPFCDGTHQLVGFHAPSGPERPLDVATPGGIA